MRSFEIPPCCTALYKTLSNNTQDKYSEHNANASQVVHVDESYSTSFYFVYPPQAKILGEFSVTQPI